MSVAGRGLVVTRDEGQALEVIGLSTRSAAPMLLHTGKAIMTGDTRPRCFAFAREGSTLLSTDGQAYATLWGTAGASEQGNAVWPKTALAVSADTSGHFVAALGDGSLIEAAANEDEPREIVGPDDADTLSPLADFKTWQVAAVSPDGQAAAWSELPVNTLSNCHIRVFERATGTVRQLKHPRVMCLAISAQGRLLALGLNNGVVRLVNLATGASDDYSWHLSRLTSLALSADGSLLVTGSTDGNVGLWDTRTRKPRSDYVHLGSPVLGVALSADARRFAATTNRDALVGDVSQQAIVGPRLL
jgi:WD40 repeat protein